MSYTETHPHMRDSQVDGTRSRVVVVESSVSWKLFATRWTLVLQPLVAGRVQVQPEHIPLPVVEYLGE